MPILGGLGACPPPGKLGVRRLNLKAFLVVLAVNQTLVLYFYFNTCLSCIRVTALLEYFDRD